MSEPSSITSVTSSSFCRGLETRSCATLAKIAVVVSSIGMTVLTCLMAAGLVGGGRAPFAGILLSPGMGCASIMSCYILIAENFPSLRLPENWAYGLGMIFGTVVVLSLFSGAAAAGTYVTL